MFRKNHLSVLVILFVLAGCRMHDKGLETVLEGITADIMKKHISVLASDDFQGRAPATEGEEKTLVYLAEQFKKTGLKTANAGSYFQEVSLVRLSADADMTMLITGGGKELNLRFSDDFIGGTPQVTEEIRIDDSEIVFIGYGINAPEFNWNDYDGLDLKGKTVMMLVNDPGYATGDPDLFNGKEMTIYGRWTWKFEEAARQGAKAAIIIHETGAAAYPWAVVQNSWSGAQYYLEGNEISHSELQLQAWVTTEAAKEMFESAGLNYELITASAAKPGFTPVSMNLRTKVHFKNHAEYVKSSNVAAVWPGSERADEYIIYTAHWDHFGINPDFEGDSILNGAVDNATGTAALIAIAEAFTRLPSRQKRSILFLSVTCEEQGLLGSEFYAKNPLFPLNKTVAVINMDGLNITGKTRDMTIIGYGYSDLDDYALAVLNKYDRYANPDPFPEKGNYFRSDHINFARAGVPALYLSKGVDDVEHGKEWGMAQSEKWIMENYHKPSDNYEPDIWRFDGMIEDVRVYFEVGYNLSNTEMLPGWKTGSPFKQVRDVMMKIP